MRILAIIFVVVAFLAPVAQAQTQQTADAAKQAMFDAKFVCDTDAPLTSAHGESTAAQVALMDAAYSAWVVTHGFNSTLQGHVNNAHARLNDGSYLYSHGEQQRQIGGGFANIGDGHYSNSSWQSATNYYGYAKNAYINASNFYAGARNKYFEAEEFVSLAMGLMQ